MKHKDEEDQPLLIEKQDSGSEQVVYKKCSSMHRCGASVWQRKHMCVCIMLYMISNSTVSAT